MSESVATEQHTEFIKTGKEFIISENQGRNTVRTKDHPQPDYIKQYLKKASEPLEQSIRKDAVESSVRLQQGFQEARDFINTVRSEFGLPIVDNSAMEIVLLNRTDFKRHYEEGD